MNNIFIIIILIIFYVGLTYKFGKKILIL